MPLTSLKSLLGGKARYGIVSLREAPYFTLAYVLWLTVATLKLTVLGSSLGHGNLFYALSFLLFFLHEAVTVRNWSRNELLLLLALLFFNIQTYLFGHDELIAFSILLFCGRKIHFKEIAWLTVVVQTCILVLFSVLSRIGLVPSMTAGRPDGTIRQSLGFAYVTYPSYLLLNIILLWIYLRKTKTTIYELVALLVMDVYMFFVTDARNGCALIAVALCGTFFIKLFGVKYNLPRWVLKIFQFDFVIAAVSFLLLSIVYLIYPHSWMLRIDAFFSKRLEYTSAALSEYGFPIIGGTHKNLASSGLVIDSSYMRIVYDYGFLFLVALLAMFTLLQKKAIMQRDNWLVFVLFFVAVHSVFDAQLSTFQCNTFLFLLATVVPVTENPCKDVDSISEADDTKKSCQTSKNIE